MVREGFTEELRWGLTLKEVRVFWGRGMHDERKQGERGDGVLVIGWGTSPIRGLVILGQWSGTARLCRDRTTALRWKERAKKGVGA